MLTRRTPILARLRRRQAIRLGLGGVAAVVLAELGGLFPVFLRPLRESGFGGRIERDRSRRSSLTSARTTTIPSW